MWECVCKNCKNCKSDCKTSNNKTWYCKFVIVKFWSWDKICQCFKLAKNFNSIGKNILIFNSIGFNSIVQSSWNQSFQLDWKKFSTRLISTRLSNRVNTIISTRLEKNFNSIGSTRLASTRLEKKKFPIELKIDTWWKNTTLVIKLIHTRRSKTKIWLSEWSLFK